MNSTDELKFLLTLLGCVAYRSPLSAFSRFKTKNKLCQDLLDRGWIDCTREIATVKLLPAGRALLKLDPSQLPIDAVALKALEKIAQASGTVQPNQVLKGTAAARQTLLQALGDRGLIETSLQIKKIKPEVWLTDRGLEYLRDDYQPQGLATINLKLLGNYIKFLRKSLTGLSVSGNGLPVVPVSQESQPSPTAYSDAEILQTIQALDRELGTKNYLPIFHLRQQLKSHLSREELDQALYRLERQNQIELSSLQEANAYPPEQIKDGIPQNIGGPLFFIIVL